MLEVFLLDGLLLGVLVSFLLVNAAFFLGVPVDQLKSTVVIGIHELELMVGILMLASLGNGIDHSVTDSSVVRIGDVDRDKLLLVKDCTESHESKGRVDGLAATIDAGQGLGSGVLGSDGVCQESQFTLVNTVDDVADEDTSSSDLGFRRAGSKDRCSDEGE